MPSPGAKKRKTRHSGRDFRMTRQEPGATLLALADTGLLRLVDELLLNVLDQINSPRDLCNFAATCTRLQGLAEPFVWRSLLVLDGTHAQNIAAALDSRDVRVDFIQELSIRYKAEYKDGIEDLNHWLTLMSNLRHLTLESPCPNNSEWRLGSLFDAWSRINYSNLVASSVFQREGLPVALSKLQSLTLHAHGPDDRKFDFDNRLASVFYHPSLRKLSMSCLNIKNQDMESTIQSFGKERKSTPLRSLTFIECNIDISTLHSILSMPKALKELSIGERIHVFPGAVPSTVPEERTCSTRFLPALQQQAESLEKLTHIGGSLAFLPSRQTDPEGSARLRSFDNLKHLELGLESHLYYYLRDNGFPPRLNSLKLLDNAISNNAQRDLASLSSILFRSTLSLVTQHFPSIVPQDFTLQVQFSDHTKATDESEQAYIMSALLNRPSIYKISDILHEHKGRFVVSRETFPSGTAYIPPFMYGEELPVEQIMYDSDNYWTFNDKYYRIVDDETFREKVDRDLVVCPKCVSRGLTERECKQLGDGSRCQPCYRSGLDCGWARDDSGQIARPRPIEDEVDAEQPNA